MKYPSDLTTKQWQIIKALFAGENRGAHFAKHTKRKLINAVFYMEKTGCQWRQLPHGFPKWSTVKSFYYRAKAGGLWERMRALLVAKSRVDAGRKSEPTYGIIDSQSTKTMYDAEERGIDGGKKRKDESAIS
jgi:putative transposase